MEEGEGDEAVLEENEGGKEASRRHMKNLNLYSDSLWQHLSILFTQKH